MLSARQATGTPGSKNGGLIGNQAIDFTIQALGGSVGQVEAAIADIRPPVINANNDGAVVEQISHL